MGQIKCKNSVIESEKTLERKLAKRILSIGGMSFKFLPLLVSGIPDRICLFKGGRIMFAEMKTTKQKPTRLQQSWINKLRELGFRVEVVDSSASIEKIISEYERE